MDTFFTEEWRWLPNAIIYLFNIAFMLYAGKWAFRVSHPKTKVREELLEDDNFAFALAHVGYYVGLIIALSSAVIGASRSLEWNIINLAIYGLLAVLLLNIASFINDKFILPHFSISKEILEDHNAGTGIVEAANFIASGLLIRAAISGDMIDLFPQFSFGWLLSGILSVLIFWSIGQVLLVLLARLFTRFLIPYDVHKEIERDNVAAGISFAGILVAIAILISYGIYGDFQGWQPHLEKIGVEVLVGIILLPLMRWLVDTILLPGQKLTKEIIHQEHPNNGAALIEALSYIGSAFLITICL